MNTHLHSKEEIKKVTHTLVDKKIWAEQLLTRVQAVLRSRGNERMRELQQLELEIRKELEVDQVSGSIFHFIWDNSEKLRGHLSALNNRLSDNDLFLCACIHAGISMSDVAEIKSVAPATINMNRYRLKKKLGLHPDEDLETYIHNLNTIN